jgi:hypothetical protein
VIVTGSDKNVVENTLQGVTNEVSVKLTTLQTGVSHANRITSLTLSMATEPTLSISKTARGPVVVLGLGLVLALAIPLVADGTARRRRKSGEGSVLVSHGARQQVGVNLPPSVSGNIVGSEITDGGPGLSQSQLSSSSGVTRHQAE